MSAYKAYIDSPYREFNHDNQAVIVTSDIENIVLATDVIGSREILAYI